MKPTIIPIIRGDDTNWNDEQTFIINIDVSKYPDLDLSDGYKAEFKLGSIVKYFDSIEDNKIEPVLTHNDTLTLPLGHIDGSVKILDKNNRIKTFKSGIHFQVKSGVFCSCSHNGPCETDISIAYGSYDKLYNKPSIDGVELKGDLSSKELGLASQKELKELSNLISEKPTIEEVEELLDKGLSELAEVAKTGSYNDLKDKPEIPEAYELKPATANTLGGVKIGKGLAVKSDGTISVIGGSGGTSDYEELHNKPSINDVELEGNKSLEDLGIADQDSVKDLQNEVTLIKNQLGTMLVFEEI